MLELSWEVRIGAMASVDSETGVVGVDEVEGEVGVVDPEPISEAVLRGTEEAISDVEGC